MSNDTIMPVVGLLLHIQRLVNGLRPSAGKEAV